MNQNPYLIKYPQKEVENLISVGSISPNIDEHGNLLIEKNYSSMFSSSITIPLRNFPCDSVKVETKYQVQFTEL